LCVRQQKEVQICAIEIEWGRPAWAAGSDKRVAFGLA
jgi:hypothetical protein